MKEQKRIIAAILAVLMMMTLMVACGDNEVPAADADQPAATEQTVEAADEETKADEAAEATKETQAATTATTAKKTESSKKSTKESTKASTKSSKEATKATTAAKVCYITVEGYCSNKKIEIKDGSSVYDVLKASGANISARSTVYGIYVEGINGRFEFDEGPDSGWVYTVNGNRINDSCDGCKVSSGDKIVWSYVK